MAKTKVRKDRHGLYVRTNGTVYRPVAARHTCFIAHAYNARQDGTTEFVEGQDVTVSHVSGMYYCRVRAGAVLEYWHGHGYYLEKKSSEECWEPKNDG